MMPHEIIKMGCFCIILGPLMAVIGRSVKQLPVNHLIDAALTLDFSRA
jgi:hypothetical protein